MQLAHAVVACRNVTEKAGFVSNVSFVATMQRESLPPWNWMLDCGQLNVDHNMFMVVPS
jgi:hypothetical protein